MLGGGGGGLGHPVSPDAVGEADAFDLDGKALADAAARGLRVSRTVQHGLHGHADTLLREDFAQQLLADPEVLGGSPSIPVERSHRAHITRQHPARLRVVRIDVDPAFGAATRQVEGAVLVRHGAGQALDLVQRDARPHAGSASGHR